MDIDHQKNQRLAGKASRRTTWEVPPTTAVAHLNAARTEAPSPPGANRPTAPSSIGTGRGYHPDACGFLCPRCGHSGTRLHPKGWRIQRDALLLFADDSGVEFPLKCSRCKRAYRVALFSNVGNWLRVWMRSTPRGGGYDCAERQNCR